MIRTQIQLPEADYEELRAAASKERRSLADCIREGIRLFLTRRRATATKLDKVAGKFRPRGLQDLKPHDRWFAEAIEDSKRGKRRR
jgi:Arc/MetJ-type ribon-helix-helix transcriptional regulator